MTQKNRGITLIALIITIIILLILAGVAISQLTGSELFGTVQLAKEESEKAQVGENETLTDYENKIDQYVDGTRNTITIDEEEYNQLKNKGKWTLLAKTKSRTPEEITLQEDLKQFSSLILCSYGMDETIINGTVEVSYDLFKNMKSIVNFVNSGTVVYNSTCSYISDTSIKLCAEKNVGKAELYGIY